MIWQRELFSDYYVFAGGYYVFVLPVFSWFYCAIQKDTGRRRGEIYKP